MPGRLALALGTGYATTAASTAKMPPVGLPPTVQTVGCAILPVLLRASTPTTMREWHAPRPDPFIQTSPRPCIASDPARVGYGRRLPFASHRPLCAARTLPYRPCASHTYPVRAVAMTAARAPPFPRAPSGAIARIAVRGSSLRRRQLRRRLRVRRRAPRPHRRLRHCQVVQSCGLTCPRSSSRTTSSPSW